MKNKKQHIHTISIKGMMASLLLGCLISCTNTEIHVPDSPYPISEDSFSLDTIARGFTIPYGIAIVEDNEYFITDRIGKMFHLKNGQQIEITGMPAIVTFGTPEIPAVMHGGLMDISIHPNYTSNGWVYLSYLAADGFAKVSRCKIKDQTATAFETIFTTRAQNYAGNGMRIVWEDDTHFFLNVGSSNFSTKANPFLNAQDLQDDAGKIHRMLDDGGIPNDNPIFEGFTTPSTIWSYGHRDVQGLYFDSATQTLFGAEHGPKGGDEFNIIEKGENYGWPLFTHGINYDGALVSTLSEEEATKFIEFPEHYWTVPTEDGGQAIGPSCLVKVAGSTVSDWNGYFVFGSLAYRRLLKYNRETNETFGLNVEGRIRTIKQLPSGDLIALIERNDLKKSNGIIVRIKGIKPQGKP